MNYLAILKKTLKAQPYNKALVRTQTTLELKGT